MKTRTILVAVAAAAILLAACVTVNVYFPAAEVKDLSRKIEDEVQKEAAKAQEKAPEAAPAPPQAPPSLDAPAEPSALPHESGSASVLDALLGVTPAYAQGGVADPEVTSPAIRKIIESRGARVAAIDKYKGMGVIGENNKALLEVRSLDSVSDLKSRAEVQRLIKDENADRDALFREIAAAKKVDAAQIPKIQETYAQTIRERAHAGEWIQMPDGAWKQK